MTTTKKRKPKPESQPKRPRKPGVKPLGKRCEPCGKLALPEDVAERLVTKLVRYAATRHFELWPCPVKAGKFHIGRKPDE